jgi:hypothetical protein
MRREPGVRRGVHAPHLLRIDHLERVTVSVPALLLHLDNDETAASAQNEIELVAGDACVGVQKPVSAQAVVPESEPLSAIHAAESLAGRASPVGFRWSLRGKDTGSADTGRMGATEDAASRRPAQPTDTASVSPGPPP